MRFCQRTHEGGWRFIYNWILGSMAVAVIVMAVAVGALIGDVRSANKRQDRGACVLVQITEESVVRERGLVDAGRRNLRDPAISPRRRMIQEKALRTHLRSMAELQSIAARLRENVDCPIP